MSKHIFVVIIAVVMSALRAMATAFVSTPEPTAAADYTLVVNVPSCAGGNLIPLTVNAGKDVKAVRYLCVEGDYAASEANFDLVAQYGDELGADDDALGIEPVELSTIIELTTERSTRFTLMVVALDSAENGTRREQVHTYFYSINDDDDLWVTVGTTDYVDDIVSNIYSSVDTSVTSVIVQEHRSTPGYYRLVNPYGAEWTYSSKNLYNHKHNHYIYIHAEDPDRVYLDESPIGVDLGHGGIAVASMATPGFLGADPSPYYGKMVEGVITFPSKALLLSMQGYNSGKWYFANANARFCVTIDTGSVGFEPLVGSPSDADPIYYDLQGRPIANPGPGLYIRHTPTSTTKILRR